MIKRKAFILSAAATISTIAGMAWATNSSDYFVIKNILSDGSTDLYVYPEAITDNSNNDPANCGNPITRYAVSSALAEEAKDRLHKTLLSAFLAGKKVSVRIQETGTACSGTSPIIIGAWVDKNQ